MKLAAPARQRGTPSRQLAGFIAEYSPEVAKVARGGLTKLRKIFPGYFVIAYDNYNALAVGFASSERASDAICSIALYPRWVTLFYLHGKKLDDPKRVLKGSGVRVRHVVLESAADLDRPELRALFKQAIENAKPLEARGKLIIKSVSTKRRPRRP
jgi:hypothetical protein